MPRPVEPNFSFRIGSITKTFTASVVLQLAEEKQLNLDDTVEKWLLCRVTDMMGVKLQFVSY